LKGCNHLISSISLSTLKESGSFFHNIFKHRASWIKHLYHVTDRINNNENPIKSFKVQIWLAFFPMQFLLLEQFLGHLDIYMKHQPVTTLIIEFKFEKNSLIENISLDVASNANCNQRTKQ